MEPTTPTPEPKPKIPLVRWLLIAFITAMLTWFAVQWSGRAKPQLDLKNTGTTAVRVRRGGDSFVMKPGQTWHLRFWPETSITLYAGETEAAPSRTVTLEKRNMQPGNPGTVAAEVRAENGTNIVFDYAGAK